MSMFTESLIVGVPFHFRKVIFSQMSNVHISIGPTIHTITKIIVDWAQDGYTIHGKISL